MMKTKKRGHQLVIITTIICGLSMSCAPKDPGFLTLVNSGIETSKISVDGRVFTLRASNHITKEISSGPHRISVDGAEPVTVNVELGRTTLFDSTGLSCYVVADYAPRYKGGDPVIIERFKMLRTFTTKGRMAAYLGGYLPKKPDLEGPVLRLQQIDCEIIDDDAEIVGSIANLQ